MKKVLKSTLVMLMVMLLAVGCSSKKDTGKASDALNKDSEFTVTVWYHPFVGADKKADLEAVFTGMSEEFTKEYKNAKVVYEEIPWANREQKITTTLAANQGPDIFYLIPDQLSQFAEDGLIEPLDDLLKGSDLSDFTDSALQSVTYKEKLYGLPILRAVDTYVYNLEVLEAVGGDANNLPKTWEEFDVLAKKAVDAGYYARTFEGANSLNLSLYPLIWQAGGEVANDKNEIGINSDKSVKAFELVNKWYQEGYIPKDSINAESHAEIFIEGKSLAAWTGTSILPALKENNVRYAIGTPLKDEVESTFGTTGTFVVSSRSKNKEGAAKYLETMTNADNMRAFNKVTNYIPPRTSALDIYAGNDELMQMSEISKIARPGVINSKARVFMPDVQAQLQAMMEGSVTPKEAADKSAQAIQTHFDN